MYNPYVAVPFAVWAIAQFLKFALAALRGKVDFKYLYASGGMPSVHAAVVTSLATTAFLIDGPHSSIFGLSTILAGIVMYDSFGVRRSTGEQAAAINVILDSMDKDKIRLAHPQQRLREILGHKPMEVTVGAVLGLVLGGLFNIDRLGILVAWLMQPVNRPEIYFLAAVSAFLIIGAFIRRFTALRKYREVPVVVKASIHAFWAAAAIGLTGLFLAFLQYENVAAAKWIVWPLLMLVILAITTAYFFSRYRVTVAAAIKSYNVSLEKKKWLEGPNKKRRAKAERSRKRK